MKLENRQPADQLDHPALRLIAARPDIFASQGHVAATYRRCNGKTHGPYYRLGYRHDGRQRSIYLGRPGRLVDRVHHTLATLQKTVIHRRMFSGLRRSIFASLRRQKLRLNTLLHPFGLRMKGFEVRGWRFSSLRRLLPRRRRLIPRVSHRGPASPFQPNNNPASRLLRFLQARDGHTPPDAHLISSAPWNHPVPNDKIEGLRESIPRVRPDPRSLAPDPSPSTHVPTRRPLRTRRRSTPGR